MMTYMNVKTEKFYNFQLFVFWRAADFHSSSFIAAFYRLTDFWTVFAKLEIPNTIVAPTVYIKIVRHNIVCTRLSVYF